MESADVFASIIAFSTTAGNRRNWDDLRGRNDSSVGAVLENDAITAIIIGVVRLEGGGIEGIIHSCVANSASHLLLFARCFTDWLLATAVVATVTTITTIAAFSTPVIPPGLINIASGSFTANLEIAAICDHDRSRRSNVT